VAVIILLGAQVIAELERKTGEKRTGFGEMMRIGLPFASIQWRFALRIMD